jgi:hypothetical protein
MTDPSHSPYLVLTASKRKWTPTPVTKGDLRSGTKETIHRALALRCLELPVRELLAAGLKRDLPTTPGVVEALESNMKDEENHDQALNYVVEAHGTSAAAEFDAASLREQWRHTALARRLGG